MTTATQYAAAGVKTPTHITQQPKRLGTKPDSLTVTEQNDG